MTNKLKHLSSATAGNTPPGGAAIDRGRLAFNVTDRKIWGYDAGGTARLIASLTTDHIATSAYRIGDLAVQGGILYRCTANIPPKAFAPADWTVVSDFRAELLYRAPTQIAQARMTMAAAAVGLRVRAHASQSAALTAWETSSGTIVSDIRADGYPGAAFGRPVFRVDQVAHGFTAVGQPVRFNGTNWVLADASVSGGAALAVVHKVLTANAVELQSAGRIDGLQNGAFEGGTRAANTRYYLSVANPGQLTSTAPPDADDENVVLHTLTADEAILNLQVPVGGGGAATGSTLTVTQSPNPFTAVGQVAAIGPTGWVLANPGTTTPVGIITATAGNDFAVALAGAVTDIVSGAAVAFPLVAGTTYYSTAAGLLTTTPPTVSALGAGPVLIATSGSTGVVVAGQATPNALRASQNLADLASVPTALTNLGLNDVVRETRQVATGTGLTGGGNLSANRTLALNASSIASLALADTSVQPARAINAGAGLTGGGDLSANRTLALTGQALALHEFVNTGIIVRTGSATYTSRAIAAGDGVSVTNGSAIGGNPTVAVDSSVVRTSRQIIAGTGLTGGGNLGADRTINLDFNSVTNLNLAATAVQPARAINTGAGLTGGGNLSMDRTLSIPNGGVVAAMLAAGVLPPELSEAQVTDPDDDETFGLVSGERLAEAVAYNFDWEFISESEITTAVAEVEFTDFAGYDTLRFRIRGLDLSVEAPVRLSAAVGATGVNWLRYGTGVNDNQFVRPLGGPQNEAILSVNVNTGETLNGYAELTSVKNALHTRLLFGSSSATQRTHFGTAETFNAPTSPIDKLTIYPVSGNFTAGTIQLYGRKR